MKIKVFFLRFLVVVLGAGLFIHTLSGIREVREKDVFSNRLDDLVTGEFAGSGVEYGFLIKDLGVGGPDISYRAQVPFPAASLIKLPILAAAFYAIEEEKISPESVVTVKKQDVTGGSGRLKALSLPQNFTIAQLMELMISFSDNTATNKIIDVLGFDYINSTFKRLNLKATTLKRKMMDFSRRNKGIENYTSPADISYLLAEIYKNRLVNVNLSKLALSFLRNQKINDRLPRYLPSGVNVAHKTGLEKGVVHDAGIVFTSRGNYLISVLVKGGRSFAVAKKFIAQLSLLAYNLYTNQLIGE